MVLVEFHYQFICMAMLNLKRTNKNLNCCSATNFDWFVEMSGTDSVWLQDEWEQLLCLPGLHIVYWYVVHSEFEAGVPLPLTLETCYKQVVGRSYQLPVSLTSYSWRSFYFFGVCF